MNNLLRMLAEGEASVNTEGLKSSASTLMNSALEIVSIVLWVLTAVLAVVFIIKAVTTAMAVMKAADEPQVRQEKLAGFKFLAIGLGIAIVVLVLANVIIQVIMDNATQNIEGNYKPGGTSFLF